MVQLNLLIIIQTIQIHLVASGNAAFPHGIVPVSQYTDSVCAVYSVDAISRLL